MMKKYLPIVLSVLLALALAVPAFAGPFADVPENHWAYEAVKHLAAYGLVIGFPDGEYKGNEPMTRYQLAMVVARMLVSLDAQIKAEVEAVKTAVPEAEKPAVEKVVERTIVETADNERLEWLEEVLAALEDEVDALDADTKAKLAELEVALVKGDVDNAMAIAALRSELAELDIPVMPEIPDVDAAVAEAIVLIDALRDEFAVELDILNARVTYLNDELQDAVARIDELRDDFAVLDEEVFTIGALLHEHLSSHEKVKITGSSEVVIEDVDIRSANIDVEAWKDPSDIFEDAEEDNHDDGAYEPSSDFKHKLDLTLTAYPAHGVTVAANLTTVTNLFTGKSAPFGSGNLQVEGLSLEITTPGVLQRLYAGGLTLPEGTFTDYTFWGSELLDDDDDPMYRGIVAELGCDKYSGTVLFTRLDGVGSAQEEDLPEGFEPGEEEEEDFKLGDEVLYAAAGEARVGLLDGLNLGVAYVRVWEDSLAKGIAESEVKSYDQVISLSGDYSFAEGWTVDGEYAYHTDTHGDLTAIASAARLNLSGAVGPVALEGEYVRVEDGFRPHFVFVDPDDDDALETDVKTIGVSAEVVPVENLTVSGGYKLTGDADWAADKTAIANVGAEYKLAVGDLVLTPSLNLEHSNYLIGALEEVGEGTSTREATLETTAAVKAEFQPLEATFTHVDARYKGAAFEPYYKRNTLELGAEYDVTEAIEVHGGYKWDKCEYDIVFDEEDDVDNYDTEFYIGAGAEFAVYEGITMNAGYDYAVANDLLSDFQPYTKSILKVGADAQVTPKSNITLDGEYQRLDRDYDGNGYLYAPVTNLIADLNYNYDITTNTVLTLGCKVIKSDVDDKPELSYLARVITGSLKVTF